jgi:electron transport complex protein RnfA
VVLAVFSGFSLNLLLQFGLGLRNLEAGAKRPVRYAAFQWIVLFVTILLLWLFFTLILSPLSLGFFEHFLIFPLCVALGQGLEGIIGRAAPFRTKSPGLPVLSAYDGLAIAALFFTLRLASSFAGAVTLSFGFSLGAFVSVLVLNAIYKRSSTERIPSMLRGMPLLLISMGLLSLIVSSVAAIVLRVLGMR